LIYERNPFLLRKGKRTEAAQDERGEETDVLRAHLNRFASAFGSLADVSLGPVSALAA
jgi:hypothetical protein